jgi:hypothetical protein
MAAVGVRLGPRGEDLPGLSHGARGAGPAGGQGRAGPPDAQPSRLRGRKRVGTGRRPGGAPPGELAELDAAFAANRTAALQNLSGAADVQILSPDGAIPVDTEVQLRSGVQPDRPQAPHWLRGGRRVFVELRVNDQVVSGATTAAPGCSSPIRSWQCSRRCTRAETAGWTTSRSTTRSSKTPASSRSASARRGHRSGGDHLPSRGGRWRDGCGGVDLPRARPGLGPRGRKRDGGGAALPPGHAREYVEALAAANVTDGKGEQLHAIWEGTGRPRRS